ncbi:MAG: hypothetical protein ACKPKO_46725, partial [Candidatus Fonsibacter sp.]
CIATGSSEQFGQHLALAWIWPLETDWHKGVSEQSHDVDTLLVLRDAMSRGADDFLLDLVRTISIFRNC